MQIITNLDSPPWQGERTVLSIGAYDGVHRGHQAIIQTVRRLASESGAKAAVMTFDRHPASVVRPESAPKLLTDVDQKLELLAATGLDATIIIHFDEAQSREEPAHFVRRVLIDCLNTSIVVVGQDFHFGRGREGNVDMTARCSTFSRIKLIVPRIAIDRIAAHSRSPWLPAMARLPICPRPPVPPSARYATTNARPTLYLAAVNSAGNADGIRRCQSTSHRDASTEASSSRLDGSAPRMPSAAANANAGSETSATMNTTGLSENTPRPIFTDAMYAANGVTAMRVNTGCVAYSMNRDAAMAAPITSATTTAIANPSAACFIVISAARK